MSINPHVQKLVAQVAEEAAPPLHVPILVGNEIIIVHQQDVRNTTDTRYLAYSKLGPNGEIIPIIPNLGQNVVIPSGTIASIVPNQAFSSPVTSTFNPTQSPLQNCTAFANLQDLVNFFQQKKPFAEPRPQVVFKSCFWESPLQQMDCSESTKPLPKNKTNTVGTSTIEIKEMLNRGIQCKCCCSDKQCEAKIIIPIEKKEDLCKNAATSTTRFEELNPKTVVILDSDSEVEDCKTCREYVNKKYFQNQAEANCQRKRDLKTRFMCD